LAGGLGPLAKVVLWCFRSRGKRLTRRGRTSRSRRWRRLALGGDDRDESSAAAHRSAAAHGRRDAQARKAAGVRARVVDFIGARHGSLCRERHGRRGMEVSDSGESWRRPALSGPIWASWRAGGSDGLDQPRCGPAGKLRWAEVKLGGVVDYGSWAAE
jgi:hypothetical protein